MPSTLLALTYGAVGLTVAVILLVAVIVSAACRCPGLFVVG